MYADELLLPWLRCVLDALPPTPIFDAHTHVGEHDPSGFTATWDEVSQAVETVGGRAAVFPLAEPSGYRHANLGCARAAAESCGTLTAFVRLTPDEEPDALLEEGLAAGARGIKLHLSSDDFRLEDPRLDRVFAVADERRLPVIVHAGPEVDTTAQAAFARCGTSPGAHLVLAHCAVSDVARLTDRIPDVPNLYVDTSWWAPGHLIAALRFLPPARVLNASDLPYCTPLSATLKNAWCAWQVGLTPEQVSAVLGGQFTRLVDGLEPLELGAAPEGGEVAAYGPLLEIVSTNLLCSLEALQRGEDAGVPLEVARRACQVPPDDPDAAVMASVLALLDLYDEHRDTLPRRNQYRPGWDLVSAAAFVARTPAAPLPRL